MLNVFNNRSLIAKTLQVARNAILNTIGDHLIYMTVLGMESDAVHIVKWLHFHLLS